MKKYSRLEELTQAMVQELIDKVIVTDSGHVENVWKFKDEVRKLIGIWVRSRLDDESDRLRLC